MYHKIQIKFDYGEIDIYCWSWGLLFRNREGYNTHLNYLSVIIVINFQKDLSNRTKVFTQKKLEKVDLVITNLFKLSHIAVYQKIQIKFDYSVFHIYRSWVMALFLLENRDFLGFRMIFKVWLNQIFSN
jgi:hypothetical protein